MSEQRDESTDQQLPTNSPTSKPVGEYLKSLIDKRTELGIKKYGTPLMTHNGRSAERDALEESVDLNQYLCQLLMEEQAKVEKLQRLLDAARKRYESANLRDPIDFERGIVHPHDRQNPKRLPQGGDTCGSPDPHHR